MPEEPFGSLRGVTEKENRRAFIEGVPDYDREFVHAGRSRNGSPGVHIITPFRTTGDTLVLVNRGWVYAPDAATVDLTRWREDRRRFHGYTRSLTGGRPSGRSQGRAVRVLGFESVKTLVPGLDSPLYLVSQDSASDRTPARLPEPSFSDGNHFGYAIQWFSFATIALVGAGIVVHRTRAQRRGSRSAEGADTAATQ